MVRRSEQRSLYPAMIGRADAVEGLYRLIDESRSAGRTALITGDAGIGKTRLIAAIRPYAAEQGFVILDGACFPQDRAEPYAPLIDALRALRRPLAGVDRRRLRTVSPRPPAPAARPAAAPPLKQSRLRTPTMTAAAPSLPSPAACSTTTDRRRFS